ncbi:hypothetical protein MPL3356_490008 [Mesorhizobium plurifarium]|uniref:Uncharacterized protein n=1 Tax=Mesorhizobium plurifarium TaxID=69974 RepID=A0A090E5P6_MESPL|nr:hypothetical protein MPL3356_490008 [Mesorhizobium plurifarium]
MVFGLGGIGLNEIPGLMIIGVDLNNDKKEVQHVVGRHHVSTSSRGRCDSEVIGHFEQASSNETKIARRSMRIGSEDCYRLM